MERKKLEPYVKLRELAEFDSRKPETRTKAHIINMVCEAFEKIGLAESGRIGDYLGVDERKLTHACELICGASLTQIRRYLVHERYLKLRREHPNWNRYELARAIGFADESVLLRFHTRWSSGGKKEILEILEKQG